MTNDMLASWTEKLDRIKKKVDYAELSRQPEDFISIRLAIRELSMEMDDQVLELFAMSIALPQEAECKVEL